MVLVYVHATRQWQLYSWLQTSLQKHSPGSGPLQLLPMVCRTSAQELNNLLASLYVAFLILGEFAWLTHLQAAAVPPYVRGLLYCSAGLPSFATSSCRPAAVSFVPLLSQGVAQAGLVVQEAAVLSCCCCLHAGIVNSMNVQPVATRERDVLFRECAAGM